MHLACFHHDQETGMCHRALLTLAELLTEQIRQDDNFVLHRMVITREGIDQRLFQVLDCIAGQQSTPSLPAEQVIVRRCEQLLGRYTKMQASCAQMQGLGKGVSQAYVDSKCSILQAALTSLKR